MSDGNGNQRPELPPRATMKDYTAPELLISALQTDKLPVDVKYMREVLIDAANRTSFLPARVRLEAPQRLVKSLNGPEEKQQLIGLVVIFPAPPAPEHQPRIISPGGAPPGTIIKP